jgi:hypothetical protein
MQRPETINDAYRLAYEDHGEVYDPDEVEQMAKDLEAEGDIEFKNGREGFPYNPYFAEDRYVMSAALFNLVARLRAEAPAPSQETEPLPLATVHEIGSRAVESLVPIAA